MALDETEDSYQYTVKAAAGSFGTDLSVSVDDDGMLTVSGDVSRTEGGTRLYRSSFRRSLTLPADADTDVLSTTYEDDRVVIAVPKLTGATKDEQSDAEGLAADSPRFARLATGPRLPYARRWRGR